MSGNGEPGSLRKRRILVVEDEEEVRILVCRILQSAGHQVETAADGAEAIRRIEDNPPDLIVLDLVMPGVDGFAVLEHLTKRQNAPPVIVLTGMHDSDSFRRGIGNGGSAYVVKPFRFHELLATCQRVLLAAGQSREVPVERRSHRRRSLIVEVNVLSKEQRPFALGELLNLSVHGACIELGVPLDVGERVRLSFHLPRGHSPHLEGEVRWRHDTTRGVAHGLSFVEVSSEDAVYLKTLLQPIQE